MRFSDWLFLLPHFSFHCLFMAMLASFPPLWHGGPAQLFVVSVVMLNRETITLFQLSEFCSRALVEISQQLWEGSGLIQVLLQPGDCK